MAVMASSALGSGSGAAGWTKKSGEGALSGGDDGSVAAAVEASAVEFGGSGADGSGGTCARSACEQSTAADQMFEYSETRICVGSVSGLRLSSAPGAIV